MPCLIEPPCRSSSPGTALSSFNRVVPCREAQQHACLPVPPCQLEATCCAVVVAPELGESEERRLRRAAEAARRAVVVARPRLLVLPAARCKVVPLAARRRREDLRDVAPPLEPERREHRTGRWRWSERVGVVAAWESLESGVADILRRRCYGRRKQATR